MLHSNVVELKTKIHSLMLQPLYFKSTEIRSKASANSLEVTGQVRQSTHFGYTQLNITYLLQHMHHCLPKLALSFNILYVTHSI